MNATSSTASPRLALMLLALGYLVFTVYGSLVPLNYRPLPMDRAWERFQDIRYLTLGIGSRADWVANILLFIPLTFLWLGVLWPGRRGGAAALLSLLLWVTAVLLSLGIEFTQLFFPPRTVSQNDIVAESAGALVGIVLWWWTGPPLTAWLQRWRTLRGHAGIAEYLLWIYLAGLFLYNVLPLDLTVSPVEMYHKWRSGGVNLIPFAYPVEEIGQYVYNLITDLVIWVPVSLLWLLSGRKTRMQAWLWTVTAALLLEIFQFFVYSRVTDVTDLFTAALGAALGVWLAGLTRAARPPAVTGSPGRVPRLVWVLAAVLLWSLALAAIFWYPYEFRLERAFLRERLPVLYGVPFVTYYYGTEFRAVTEVLHNLLFFAPLGALLGFGRIGLRRGVPRTLYDLFAAAIVIGVPFVIELGQVALPSKFPSNTDWLLAVIGATAGFFGVLLVDRRLLLSRPLVSPAGRSRNFPPEKPARR